MTEKHFDFATLTDLWRRSLERGLTKMARGEPEHHFYALAFDNLYAEEDGIIAMPIVGLNSLEALKKDHGPAAVEELGFGTTVRWNPCDWHWSELELPYRRDREKAYRELTREARRSTTKHWHLTEARHRTALVKALPAQPRP